MAKFDLNKSPGHLLNRARQYSFDQYAKEVGSSGLTPRQFTVLHAVSQNQGCSQTALVKLTGIDRSTLADMIGRMLKKRLLSRRRTKTDARANAVGITSTGRKAMNRVREKAMKADAAFMKAVPSSQRASFLRALRAVSDAIDKEVEESLSPSRRRSTTKRKAKRKSAKSAKRKSAPRRR